MAIETVIELDEVEALDVSGKVKEVHADNYNLPLARALRGIEYNEALSAKAWLDGGLEEVLALLDLTDEHKDVLRSRDLEAIKTALTKEAEEAGLPVGMHIVWALVRIEGPK